MKLKNKKYKEKSEYLVIQFWMRLLQNFHDRTKIKIMVEFALFFEFQIINFKLIRICYYYFVLFKLNKFHFLYAYH